MKARVLPGLAAALAPATPFAVGAANPASPDALRRSALGATLLTLLLAAGVAVGSVPAETAPSVVPTNHWVTDGPVEAIARGNGVVYVGGGFSLISPRTGSFAGIAANGKLDAGWPEVLGSVTAIVSDGHGGWFIGGSFTAVGGVPRHGLAHLTAGKRLDTGWNPAPDGTITALVLRRSTLYVGGTFHSIGGKPRENIAALDTRTGRATGWNPGAALATGGYSLCDGVVCALALSPDGRTLFAGGAFVRVGHAARESLAAFDAVSGSLRPWQASRATGAVAPLGEVDDLAPSPDGSVLYAAGDAGGNQGYRAFVAGFHARSGRQTGFDVRADAGVVGLAVSPDDSTVYVGGHFRTIAGSPLAGLAALDSDGRPVDGFSPRINDLDALALGRDGSKLYASTREDLAAVDAATGARTSRLLPTPNATVNAIVQQGSRVYLGGDFNGVGGVRRPNLAALNAATGAPTGWNPGLSAPHNGYVRSLALHGSTLYVGGHRVTKFGGRIVDLAAVDTRSGAARAWGPPALYGPVVSIAVAPNGPAVYLATDQLHALDTRGRPLPTWRPSPFGVWYSWLSPDGATVYASATNPAQGLVRALAARTGALRWNTHGAGSVRALAAQGSTVYVGGEFTRLGGADRENLAALDVRTGAASSWNPHADRKVQALLALGHVIVAGGDFSTIGGQKRSGLTALDASSGRATPWNPSLGAFYYPPVFSLVPSAGGSTLYVGGGFDAVGLVPQSGVAFLPAPR
jgi:hypothetical protein